nr:hypothetical protein P5627_06950 [Bacillus safensis]
MSRILFYYAINLLIYFVFIGLASMVIGIESEGHGLASLSILLITVMAVCTGFIVKISEFNKLFVIVMMIAVFSFIDMLLLKWLSSDVYLLATAYLLGSLAFYSCIYTVMLKSACLAMIELVCSFLAVVVIHELGHMLMVMLCNKIEKSRSLIL